MRLFVVLATLIIGMLGSVYLTGKLGDVALNLAFSAFGFLLGYQFYLPKGMRLQAILASTLFRWRRIRVSVSYLVNIEVEGRYLLVRGNRIRTQFQPVGGVFKVRQNIWEQLTRELSIEPDKRFLPDADNAYDLRLFLHGKNLPRLLDWIAEMKEIEAAPWREFSEELIVTGILSAENFRHGHFERARRRHHDGIRYDEYSKGLQIIIADIYTFYPNPSQAAELKMLVEKSSGVGVEPGEFIFVDHEQLSRTSPARDSRVHFEITPTANL